jgi:hypothetical protein
MAFQVSHLKHGAQVVMVQEQDVVSLAELVPTRATMLLELLMLHQEHNIEFAQVVQDVKDAVAASVHEDYQVGSMTQTQAVT